MREQTGASAKHEPSKLCSTTNVTNILTENTMKVSFNQYIRNLDGIVLKEDSGDGKVNELMLSGICTNALLVPQQVRNPANRSKELTGQEKVERYELALRLHKSDVVDVSAEEISLLKLVVAEAFAPLIVGQALKLLEKVVVDNGS